MERKKARRQSIPALHLYFSRVRPREGRPFKVGKKARLRVNLEQAPAFRSESREVHFPFFGSFNFSSISAGEEPPIPIKGRVS
jgi:hypothetical protein